MDSNVTLNTELFPVGLIEVLSYRCNFCELAWFKVSKPLLCFSSLHKAAAPILLEAYVQRCCWLPSVVLVAFPSSHFQIPPNKNTLFTICRGWRYCPAHVASIHILHLSRDFFEKLLSWYSGYVKSELNLVLILWTSEFDSWITDGKDLYFWHS